MTALSKIEFTLSRPDLLRARTRAFLISRFYLALYFAMGAAFFWAVAPTSSDTLHLTVTVIAGILTGILFWIMGSLLTIVLLLIGTFRANTGILGRHEIELTEEGLIERTDVNQTLHRWAGFHRVFQTGGHLCIYVTDTQAHFIPRRAFSTHTHLVAFLDEINRRVTAAKGARNTPP